MSAVTIDVWEKVDVQYQVTIPKEEFDNMSEDDVLEYICCMQPPRKQWTESVEERGYSYVDEDGMLVEGGDA